MPVNQPAPAPVQADLPEPLRVLAGSLRGRHTNDCAAARPRAEGRTPPPHREVFTSTTFRTEHPLLRVHPETGERALLLGDFLQQTTGLGGRCSQALLRLFRSHIERPGHTVRRRWREGDVAIRDNRTTQRYGVDDSGGRERRLRRGTVDGDVPVGPDGRRSRPIAPEEAPAPGFGVASGESTAA